MDWSGCELVEVIPGKHSGDPMRKAMRSTALLFIFLTSFGLHSSKARTAPSRMTPGELASELRIVASELRNLDSPLRALDSKYGPPNSAGDDHELISMTAALCEGSAAKWEKNPSIEIKTFYLFSVFSGLDNILLQARDVRATVTTIEDHPSSIASELRAMDASTMRLQRARSSIQGELEIRLAGT